MRYKQLSPVKNGNFYCQLLLHSQGPAGQELYTFQTTYERMIHAEFMTHRVSRNASSSRAIPYERNMEWIGEDPACSLHLGKNKSGMQSGELVVNAERLRYVLRNKFDSVRSWCDAIVKTYNPHKEIINRYTEPWGWITVVSTWSKPALMNYYNLRINPMANPNIQRLAVNMARLTRDSAAQSLDQGEWHTPYFYDYVPRGDIHVKSVHNALVWSTARCAWTSYNSPTKDASQGGTFEKALVRHDDCVKYKHVTPLEHQKQARPDMGRNGGTAAGWNEYRHFIPGESAVDFDYSVLDNLYGDCDYVVN